MKDLRVFIYWISVDMFKRVLVDEKRVKIWDEGILLVNVI